MEPLEAPHSGASNSGVLQIEGNEASADLQPSHTVNMNEQRGSYRSDTGAANTPKGRFHRRVGKKSKAKGEPPLQTVEWIDLHNQNRVIRLVPAAEILPAAAPEREIKSPGIDSPEDDVGEKKEGTDKEATTLPTPKDLCVRIPFSHRCVVVYTEHSHSTANSCSWPPKYGASLPWQQRLFCCFRRADGVGETRESSAAYSYMCGHILQEAAWRISEATGLTVDPFADEGHQNLPALLFLSASSSVDTNKRGSSSFRDPEAAKAALLQSTKVALLLEYYERLLAAETMQLVPKGGRSCPPFAASDASSDDLLSLKPSSRFPRSLLSTPFFSCLPIAPWHLWWPKESLDPEHRCSFRVSVQLLHVSLSDCHLFREEDLLAQKLLSAYEVYAYLARCSSGEQLAAKLRSCIQYTKEMRESCGLPRELQPLLQAAAAAVAAYRRDQPPDVQQALLLQSLQQMQQLPHQVQQLTGWLCILKAEYPQVRPCNSSGSCCMS